MKCSVCNREASRDNQVKDCDKCEHPVCGECAEVDYDMVDDPPSYVNTQWQHDSLKGGCPREGRL
jgi:hypothetical protein